MNEGGEKKSAMVFGRGGAKPHSGWEAKTSLHSELKEVFVDSLYILKWTGCQVNKDSIHALSMQSIIRLKSWIENDQSW